MPTYMLARVTLKEDSALIRPSKDKPQTWQMVLVRGPATVAAGILGINKLSSGVVPDGAEFMVNVDLAEWEEFEASRMEEGDDGSDEVFNTLRGLFKGSIVTLQLELDYRFRRSAGRNVLGLNIVSARVDHWPPVEEVQANRIPALMMAIANGSSGKRGR